ncbi:unnamed protein product [Amoebophrya sp. A25]|nr:unnamed protein product [Amoebophrya sp. A25]|eukprot:GSA25T00011691001.1
MSSPLADEPSEKTNESQPRRRSNVYNDLGTSHLGKNEEPAVALSPSSTSSSSATGIADVVAQRKAASRGTEGDQKASGADRDNYNNTERATPFPTEQKKAASSATQDDEPGAPASPSRREKKIVVGSSPASSSTGPQPPDLTQTQTQTQTSPPSKKTLDLAEAQRALKEAFRVVQIKAQSPVEEQLETDDSSREIEDELAQLVSKICADQSTKRSKAKTKGREGSATTAGTSSSSNARGGAGPGPSSSATSPGDNSTPSTSVAEERKKRQDEERRKALAKTVYPVKCVEFEGKRRQILMQSENGPCPFLAICNILLLQGKFKIAKERVDITFGELVEVIANFALERAFDYAELQGPDFDTQEIVQGVMRILPKLHEGLDVNVYFRSIDKFEFTEELGVFDLLSLPIFHGWICPPSDLAHDIVVNEVGSYNKLVEKLFEYEELAAKVSNEEGTHSDADLERLQSLSLLRDWNGRTAAQLTYAGLIKLHESVPERSLAVFLRNNHFSTIYKLRQQVYALNTDLGFLDDALNVWERVTEVDGNTVYVDALFQDEAERNKREMEEADHQLALEILKRDEVAQEAQQRRRRGPAGDNLQRGQLADSSLQRGQGQGRGAMGPSSSSATTRANTNPGGRGGAAPPAGATGGTISRGGTSSRTGSREPPRGAPGQQYHSVNPGGYSGPGPRSFDPLQGRQSRATPTSTTGGAMSSSGNASGGFTPPNRSSNSAATNNGAPNQNKKKKRGQPGNCSLM